METDTQIHVLDTQIHNLDAQISSQYVDANVYPVAGGQNKDPTRDPNKDPTRDNIHPARNKVTVPDQSSDTLAAQNDRHSFVPDHPIVITHHTEITHTGNIIPNAMQSSVERPNMDTISSHNIANTVSNLDIDKNIDKSDSGNKHNLQGLNVDAMDNQRHMSTELSHKIQDPDGVGSLATNADANPSNEFQISPLSTDTDQVLFLYLLGQNQYQRSLYLSKLLPGMGLLLWTKIKYQIWILRRIPQ